MDEKSRYACIGGKTKSEGNKKKKRKPLTHFVTLHFQWRRPKPYPSFTRSNLSSPINFKWYPSLPFVLSQLHTYHFPFFFSNFLFLWRDFLFSSISEGFCRIPPNSFHFMANNWSRAASFPLSGFVQMAESQLYGIVRWSKEVGFSSKKNWVKSFTRGTAFYFVFYVMVLCKVASFCYVCRLLQEFVQKHEGGLEVVYALSGWLKSNHPSYHVRLVTGPKLEGTCMFCKIYSNNKKAQNLYVVIQFWIGVSLW